MTRGTLIQGENNNFFIRIKHYVFNFLCEGREWEGSGSFCAFFAHWDVYMCIYILFSYHLQALVRSNSGQSYPGEGMKTGIDISCKRVPSSTKVQHFCILQHATLDSRDFRFLLCHSLLNESPSAGPKAKDAHTSTARMVLGIPQSLVKSFARKSVGQSVVCNWDKM